MKKFIGIFLFLLLINLVVPVLYYNLYSAAQTVLPVSSQSEEISSFAEAPSVKRTDTVTIYDSEKNEAVELSLIDYLVGAAACEMPASYEAEAIKAQMIAIHSYYEYCQVHPEYINNGYVTFNETLMQGYASKNRLMDYWQLNFYDYYQKFLRCANEVSGYILKYESSPALTTYYAVSCGKTQKSLDEWQMDLPYLTTVDSSFDAVSDDYLQMKTFEKSELYSRLNTSFSGLKLDEDTPEKWFGDIIYNEAGYADFVTVGGVKIPGSQFRKALQLPSSCLLVFFEDDTFSIATKGYGHGVGLSQFGANQLSQSGKNYKEILMYYYPNTQLDEML